MLSHGSAGAPDVVFLDHALRSLGHAAGRVGGAGLPDITAVRMVADRLELRLEVPHPTAPPPWAVDYSGCCWSIGRNDPLPVDAANAAAYLAPYPALVGIGYGADGDGDQWLLDLERAGSVSLTGDPQHCLDLGRFIAAELAVNAWSEQLSVTLVGFGAELVPLNPERLRYTEDLAAAAALLRGQRGRTVTALQATGSIVLDGRLADTARLCVIGRPAARSRLHRVGARCRPPGGDPRPRRRRTRPGPGRGRGRSA
ncbi:MAG: hypothetical protein QOC93_502 [Actinomycetota bacterium]|nr:hypothetical protein [Actinomycetota bacterium]